MQQKHVKQSVTRRVNGHGSGWIFTHKDFVDLGSDGAIRISLLRLKNAGKIRQVMRGIYDLPKTHPKLGQLAPSLDGVLKAIQRRDNVKTVPSGAHAANLLGLSNQVPMQMVMLTDGSSRDFNIGSRTLKLRHASPSLLGVTKQGAIVIQALRYLGKDSITSDNLNQIRKVLDAKSLKDLAKDAKVAPVWIAKHLMALAA